jgi:hypothetical protein
MIYLKTNKITKKKYSNIDFEILQEIANILFYTIGTNKRSYIINIQTVHSDECLYFNNKKGRLYIKMADNLKDDNAFIKYFLHEYRHFLQDKALHIVFNDDTYKDSTYEEYINSPLEKDVTLFLKEHLANFCKIYGKMKKYKEDIKKFESAMTFTGFKTEPIQ